MRVRKKSKDSNSDSNKILSDETKDKSKSAMPPELEIKATEETKEGNEKGLDERQLEEEMEDLSRMESGPMKEKKAEDV